MLWENLREPEFKDAVKASNGVCLVPIGCLERHGPHSPIGTDIIIAEGVTREAADIEPCVVFPTMYFGDKTGAGEFAGTVIFSEATRWAIFKETCNEICRNGFNKILFCNGHGGNNAMLSAFCRAMMQENPKVMTFYGDVGAVTLSYKGYQMIVDDKEKYSYLTDEDRAIFTDFIENKKQHGHACIYETGTAYSYRPETVRLDLIKTESGDSNHRFDEFAKYKINTHFSWMGNYPNSYSASNDYEMNERIARSLRDSSVYEMVEWIKFLKNETISNEYHAEWINKQ